MMGVDEYTEEEKLAMRDISPATSGEIFSAYAGEAFDQGTLMSNIRRLGMKIRSTHGPQLSPQELDEKFPDLKGKFNRPMTESEANMVQERHTTKKEREAIKQRAHGLFDGTVLPFMASAIGAMSDPIDLAVGYTVGAGIGAAAKGANIALKGASAFGADVLGNMVGNAITEVSNATQTQNELLEYTKEQAFNSVVLSSVFASTVSTAGAALFKKLGSLGPRQMDNISEVAQTAIDNGKSPSAVLNQIDKSLGEDLKVEPAFKSTIDSLEFKNAEVKAELLKAETYTEFRDTLKDLSKKDMIDDFELSKLKTSLNDSGVLEGKSYIFDGESQIKFNSEKSSNIANTLDDFKNDINYHPKFEEEAMTAPDYVDPDSMKKIADLDERIKSLENNFKESDRAGIIAEVDKSLKVENGRLEYAKFMTECLAGAVVGG